MRRILYLSAVCLAAGLAGACKPETIVKTEDIPMAGVRFINAVTDTAGAFGLDLRWVDIVENNAQYRISFRNNPATSLGVTASTQTEYKPARAGSRHFRIFLDDSIAAITQTVLKDTTVNLTAGSNYTAILWGSARAGTMKLVFYEEVITDPGANVALRVINATPSPIDVSAYVKGTAVPGSPTWSSVAAYSRSSFVNVPPALIMYNVRAAGSATNMFADIQALAGAAASSSAGTTKLDIAPIPGTLVAGSAVTMVVFPAATVPSRVPQTAAFLVPAGAFMWDRRPPNPAGT